MAVTVTKATLGRNVPFFIAEVLRQNLTDTQGTPRAGKEWIFKSQPTDPLDKTDALPRIVIDVDGMTTKSINMPASKYVAGRIPIDIIIYTGGSGALSNRDTYCDSIRELLFDPTSADENSITLAQNYLLCRSISESVEDFFGGHSQIIRSKRLSCEFRYSGG